MTEVRDYTQRELVVTVGIHGKIGYNEILDTLEKFKEHEAEIEERTDAQMDAYLDSLSEERRLEIIEKSIEDPDYLSNYLKNTREEIRRIEESFYDEEEY